MNYLEDVDLWISIASLFIISLNKRAKIYEKQIKFIPVFWCRYTFWL